MTDTNHNAYDTIFSPHNEGIPLTREFSDVTLGALNDTARVCQIPRGRSVHNVFMQSGDFDTGTAHVMSLEITDGTTTVTLIDDTDIGQAGGYASPSKAQSVEDGLGWVAPNDNYRLQVRCTTAATGAQAADLLVGFTICGAYDTGAIS